METLTRHKEALGLKHGVAELRELLRTLGHEPELINTHALEEIAAGLSDLAGLAEEKRWSWRYLNQVLHNKLPASGRMYHAILRQGALSDGVSALVVASTRVVVVAPRGVTVQAGALVLADSKRCACGLWFVPKVPWQRFHSRACGQRVRKG